MKALIDTLVHPSKYEWTGWGILENIVVILLVVEYLIWFILQIITR